MDSSDNKLLRKVDGSACAAHFRQLQQNGLSEADITSHLLDAVRCQSISPVPLMSVWLSFAQSPKTLKTALQQNFSLRTRNFALRAFVRLLRRSQWRLLWTEFGGLEGIMYLFSQLSVREVALITKIIGRQVKSGHDPEREAAMSDLLRALLGVDGVDAMHRNPDQRHLVGNYLKMLPACDSSFVEEMLCERVRGLPDCTWNLRHFSRHSALIARLTSTSAFKRGDLPDRAFGRSLSFCLNNLQQGFPREPGCSISMSFMLSLLRRLAAEQTAQLPLDKYVSNLLEALVEQSWKRKESLGPSKLADIVNLCISCISRHPEATTRLSTGPNSLLDWVVRCWSLTPHALEDALQNLLGKLGTKITAGNVTSVAQPLLRAVGPDLQYQLLRKLFSNASGLYIDIDFQEQLARSENNWECEIFLILPKKDAIPLLERLRQVKPELYVSKSYGSSDFQTSKTIVVEPSILGATKADTNFLYHTLRRDQEGALDSSTKFLAQQKRKAVSSRDQTDRAFYARASLLAAVATGSLPLLRDTITWLRRYTKDNLTVRNLYSETTFKTEELIDLLAGVPQTPSEIDSPIGIKNAIYQANEILKEIYETMFQAVREPSFYASDWQGPLGLFRSVTATRLNRVKSLQRVLQLSDEQLFDIVWKDTLQMLIGIEKNSIEETTGRLDFGKPSGPLCYDGVGYTMLKQATPASYRFIDELAKARDSLWRNVRRLRNSSVAALPDPWPRGLAIQHLLISLDVADSAAKGYTPYLSARAKSIVFTRAAEALSELPKDKDTQAAIGEFVDEYDTSLKIYVFQEDSPRARQLHVEQAWKYAIQSFTRLPLTEDEAIRYIHGVFKNVVSEFRLPRSSIDNAKLQLYPVLHDVDGQINDGSFEWDPLETKPTDVEYKIFEPRTIDCMFPGRSHWNMFSPSHSTIPGWSADPIWSFQRFNPGRIPWNQTEALILSKLLYLDGKIGGEYRQLLVEPFPSAEDARYPSVFLDSEFLLRGHLGTLNLEPLAAHVPVDLVRSLADRAMEQLLLTEERIINGGEKNTPESKVELDKDSSKTCSGIRPSYRSGVDFGHGRERGAARGRDSLRDSVAREQKQTPVQSRARIVKLERVLYDLVAFLAASDRPQLAADLILQIILNRPEASSWYRKLLGLAYMECLPSADVQVFFSDFVAALSERLAEQEAHKDDKKWKGPYVKVTTIKYVAQLLNEADFISRLDAVKVLVKLYAEAKHIDVRVAVVESMLGMLTTCKSEADEPVASAIIEGLKVTIPLLGGLSERRQINEEDWLKAETTGALPEVVYDIPIAKLLINAIAGRDYSIDLKYRRSIMSEVMNPVFAASALTNERWVKLFAVQQGIDLGLSESHMALLVYPIQPKIIESLLSLCPTLITEHVLQRYHKHNLALIDLPSDFVALNSKIKADVDLVTSTSGKTFPDLYSNNLQQYRDAMIYFSMLRGKWRPSLLEDNGIRLSTVQKMLSQLAPKFLAHYNSEPVHFDAFIAHFQPSFQLDAEARRNWTTNIRPVLSDILSSISSARTNLTLKSHPSILPDTFTQTLWLLPWPTSAKDSTTPFTESLLSVLGNLTRSGSTPAYHKQFTELQTLLDQLPTVSLAVQIAVELGERSATLIPRPNPLCEILIAEVQARLLQRANGAAVDGGIFEKVKAVARAWIAHEDEEARRRGFAVLRAAEQARVR